MNLVAKGRGIFEVRVNKSNLYIYDNASLTVYYQFKEEEKVELEVNEIPDNIKKVIINSVPESVQEDLYSMGW